MNAIPCCYCAFEGTERQVRAHVARSHAALAQMAVRQGRPPKEACPLCRMVHDEVFRPGWAARRKKLERPKAITVQGELSGPGQRLILGTVKIPPGARRITNIRVVVEHCQGPFEGPPDDLGRRYCVRDGRYHHVVVSGSRSAPR